MKHSIASKVYEIVKQIPRGKVMTYGQIAKKLKTPPRVVGNALHRNPDPASIPCHRVVNWEGRLAENYAFGGAEKQRRLLLLEGVKFKDKTHVAL